ncbi:MAG: hypothetical protein KF799_07870 [Bdellovibrionales bacterium]|nr:hypothetical protein [Bdellovibrionales bacterium]
MNRHSLSEPHNFGRRVTLTSSGDLVKPRPLFWEWLFYSSNPFRQALDNLSIAEALPLLKYSGTIIAEGQVERLLLTPIESVSNLNLHSVGSCIAIYSFFGISDLHRENMMFGKDGAGTFRFCAIDIEDFFGDFSDAGQTGLLPTVSVPRALCGLSELLQRNDTKDSLNAAAACCAGFIKTMATLSENETYLTQLMLSLLTGQNIPIRIVARKTLSYTRFLQSATLPQPPESPFCEPELEQLTRGDVPYFFRYPNSSQILMWTEPTRTKDVTEIMNAQFDFLQCRLVKNGQLQKRRFLNDLLQRGALQILRAYLTNAKQNSLGQFGDIIVKTMNGLIHLDTGRLKLSCKPMA